MHRKLRFFTAFTCLASAYASATDFCVQTDAQFASALALQEIVTGPNTIRLGAAKTFHVANTAFDDDSPPYDARRLTIAGGYDATCSAQITHDASSTVIDGTGAGDGLNWFSVDGGAQLTLSTLTIAHLAKPLDVIIGGDDARLLLQRVRFVDGASVSLAAGTGEGSSIVVRDSVFARMSGELYEAALALGGLGNDGTSIQIINTTVTASQSNGVDVYNPHGVTWLYNDILYANNPGFVDLRQNEGIWAFDNTIGSHDGAFLAGSSGNLASNPQFVSTTDYNLQFTSPARDSGTSAVPGGLGAYDVEGGVRVVGAGVDRGAYENDASGATVLLVTNTGDSGTGSLRQAILDANANPSFNIIGFNISGACPRTIQLDTDLPAITDAVAIRGYSQPGAQANSNPFSDNATICVELAEASGHTVVNGLHFTAGANGDSFDVSGLSIGGFTTGILVDGNADADFSIWGNFIGLAADGTTARANSFIGINVTGHAQGAIGGSDPAQCNVIAGSGAGVRLAGDRASSVAGNLIGTGASGSSARPNTIGVAVLSPSNSVTDNVISGNSGYGISVSGTNATDNLVQDNRIGLKAFSLGSPALGNGDHGILVGMGANSSRIVDNTIADNGGAGVRVTGDNSVRNRITGNRIYDNTALGIDLGVTGADPIDNDATATDAIPNHGQNAPELDDAHGGDTYGQVYGQLQSANGSFRIDLYASDACDASGYGEGRELVGSGSVAITNGSASANGSATFAIPVASDGSLDGRAITAIATVVANAGSMNRVGDSSEFSDCHTYQVVDVIFADGFDPPQP